MKLGYALVAVILAGGLVAAQDVDQRTKTKVKVEDGRDVTVTGCLARAPEGTGYMLTNVAGKNGALGSYVLTSDDQDDLAKHVGHRVEITGKAADQGKGKLKVETKNEVRTPDGDKKETESKSEVKGDLAGLPFLGVKSIRMVASVCP